MRRLFLTLAGIAVLVAPALAQTPAPQPGGVFLEDLTWPEARDAIAAGKTTIIIPTGGTEQNGPHMVLGKHNYLVKYKAGEIARQLGNALVAPVVAYVPEGEVTPPTSHMRFAGTITTPQDVFAKVLEYAARSFRQHGFLDIALVGDSGGNQAGQALVAAALNKEWAGTNVRVHHITAYYPGRGDDWVVSQGVSAEDVGSHAGTHDTSSLMFLNPAMLRFDKLGPGKAGDGQGHVGNPARSTALFGKQILEMQIADAAKQIQELRVGSRRVAVAAPAAPAALPPALQQAPVRSDQDLLIDLEQRWNQAFYRKDVAFIETILADEFMAIYDDGSRGDRRKELALAAEFNQNVESAVPDEFTVKVFRDTAVVWFTLNLVGIREGQRSEMKLRYTDVWVIRDGRWQCVSTQSTRVSAR